MQKINLYLKLLNYIPLFIILFFVLILVIGGIIIWPKFTQYTNIRQEIELKQIELDYNEIYLAELASIKDKLNEKETEILKISSALPQEASIPSIYKFIEQTASVSGVVLNTLSSFSVSSSELSDRVEEISFSVKVEGSYNAIKEFIKAVQESSKLFEVGTIALAPSSDDMFTASLNLKTFTY